MSLTVNLIDEDTDALDFIGRPYWFDRPSQAEGEDA